jgi:hypothetical protein
MAGYVIRRARKEPAVELVPAPPIAPRFFVEKPRNRDVHRRAEVLGLFREQGARVDLGDPMKSARDEYRCGGDS